MKDMLTSIDEERKSAEQYKQQVCVPVCNHCCTLLSLFQSDKFTAKLRTMRRTMEEMVRVLVMPIVSYCAHTGRRECSPHSSQASPCPRG